jgi:3D (Asp-Asp-Asp) domain-containing protein
VSRRLRTEVARVTVAAVAAIAILRPQQRPGTVLRADPVVVTSELRAAPLVVFAENPAAAALPSPEAVARAAEAAPRRLAPFAPLHERARAGHRITVHLTAYCLRGLTRIETQTRPGIIAADPKYFPLRRYIDVRIGRKVQRYRVEDTGSAIKGPRLDVWLPTCDEARRFGRRRGTATLVMTEDVADGEPGR